MLPKVSIVILNYNGLSDSIKCLDSLFSCDYENMEIIMLDNGSKGDDVSVLSVYKPKNNKANQTYRFIDNKGNLGFAGGCNVGMKIALEEAEGGEKGSKYIYLLNNDTEVATDFLTKAVEYAEKHSDVGVVASKSLYFENREVIENAGHLMLNSGDAYSRGRGAKASDVRFVKRTELLSACAAGILLRNDMIREIGMFDEEFFLIYEDVDLTFRAVVMGWKCVYLPESVMYHKVSASIVKSRNYEMTLRAQVNQFRAYVYNVPAVVFILNLPWIVLRFFMVLIGGVVFGQFRMVKVFLVAHYKLFGQVKTVLKKRKFVMGGKKVSWWYVWRRQRNFLPYSFGYFWDIVVARKRKSIFES